MSKKKAKLDPKMQAWVDAKRRHRLSRAHIHMAYELGMNPKKFGKIDNHKQEPWKAPLPIFIEDLYFKRFGKYRPDVILSIEDRVRLAAEKKAKKREAKLLRRETKAAAQTSPESEPPTSESACDDSATLPRIAANRGGEGHMASPTAARWRPSSSSPRGFWPRRVLLQIAGLARQPGWRNKSCNPEST